MNNSIKLIELTKDGNIIYETEEEYYLDSINNVLGYRKETPKYNINIDSIFILYINNLQNSKEEKEKILNIYIIILKIFENQLLDNKKIDYFNLEYEYFKKTKEDLHNTVIPEIPNLSLKNIYYQEINYLLEKKKKQEYLEPILFLKFLLDIKFNIEIKISYENIIVHKYEKKIFNTILSVI